MCYSTTDESINFVEQQKLVNGSLSSHKRSNDHHFYLKWLFRGPEKVFLLFVNRS